MTKLVLLDTVVLGLATNPKGTVNSPVLKWINRLMSDGHQPYVPEIADYELRRELIRLGSNNAISRLNGLSAALGYIPIETATMRRAAELWAQSRKEGRPLAHERALDGDIILCAQAHVLADASPHNDVIIATTNVGHLGRFADADEWHRI